MDEELYNYGLPEEAERYWTRGRIFYLVVTLLTLVAFLIYIFVLPLIEANRRSDVEPRETPTVLPRF